MHALGQVEVVVLLQCLPEEKSFPKDIFRHFIQLYRDALTGETHSHYHYCNVVFFLPFTILYTVFLCVRSSNPS